MLSSIDDGNALPNASPDQIEWLTPIITMGRGHPQRERERGQERHTHTHLGLGNDDAKIGVAATLLLFFVGAALDVFVSGRRLYCSIE